MTDYVKIRILLSGVKDLARNPNQLGNLIRRARKRKGWSQTELAQNARLQQRQISLIENGYSSTKLQTLLALTAALDLDLVVAPRSRADW